MITCNKAVRLFYCVLFKVKTQEVVDLLKKCSLYFFQVLSWLNPVVQVNTRNKTFTPGVALKNARTDQWSDIT